MRLRDKVSIITGAGSGIGRASALLFAREGACVVVADIDRAGGEETVNLIKQDGGQATFVQVDVSRVADMEKMIKVAVKSYGKLNILFNNAGMPGPIGIEKVTEAEWDNSMAVLSKGPFFACKFAIPEMRKVGGGSIIFTTSTSGVVGSNVSPTYSMGKGAIALLAKSLAKQLGPEGIRVNCLCPGPTETGFAGKFFAPYHQDPGEMLKRFKVTVPLGRRATPEEQANAALFLASDESSYVTGVTLNVDGGQLA